MNYFFEMQSMTYRNTILYNKQQIKNDKIWLIFFIFIVICAIISAIFIYSYQESSLVSPLYFLLILFSFTGIPGIFITIKSIKEYKQKVIEISKNYENHLKCTNNKQYIKYMREKKLKRITKKKLIYVN